jgi:hypothetical protein
MALKVSPALILNAEPREIAAVEIRKILLSIP